MYILCINCIFWLKCKRQSGKRWMKGAVAIKTKLWPFVKNKKKHVLKFSCIFFISELLCGLTQAQAQMDAELLWLYFKSPLSWRSEACLEQRLASTSDYSTHKHTYTLTAIRQSIEANTSEHLTTQLCMREEKRRANHECKCMISSIFESYHWMLHSYGSHLSVTEYQSIETALWNVMLYCFNLRGN